MDIKLTLDGGFELQAGDFAVIQNDEYIISEINKIVRGWVGSFNIMKYAGMKNTKETGMLIKQDLEYELKKYIPTLLVKVFPISMDGIGIFVYTALNNTMLSKYIFSYSNGIIKYIDNNILTSYYREATNVYF